MDEWHPESDEELHRMSRRGQRWGTTFSTLAVSAVVLGFALGAILQIQVEVNFSTWPKPIQFLTTPPGMVLILLGFLLLALKSLPSTRRLNSMKRYFRAIDNYNRGRQAYDLWKKKGRNRDLQRCRRFLQAARWCLKDVPEFAKLWDKVEEKSGMDSAP